MRTRDFRVDQVVVVTGPPGYRRIGSLARVVGFGATGGVRILIIGNKTPTVFHEDFIAPKEDEKVRTMKNSTESK